jgi:energy-coupling factor transporter ATP-binding protein EcfA2
VKPSPLSHARRHGLAEAAERAPVVTWNRLRVYLQSNWLPGQHVTIAGPNGSGKSTVLTTLLGAPNHRPSVVVVTKARDSIVDLLAGNGWKVCRTLAEVERAIDPPAWRFWRSPEEAARRTCVVYWPHVSTSSTKARRAELSEDVGAFLDWCYGRGDISVGIDETMFVVDDLRLRAHVQMLLHEGRSSGVSVVIATQRPAWLPRSAYSAATLLVLFRTADHEDAKRYADIGGSIDPRTIRTEVGLLRRHEALWLGPRDDPPWLVRATVPERREKPRP